VNIATLEDTLYDWVYAVTTPVVSLWLDQNSPRPAAGYVGMRHSALRPLGTRGYKSNPAGATNVTRVTQDVEFILMFIGYGTGATEIYKLFDAVQNPTRRQTLSLAGVAIVGVEGTVMNISELVGSQIEPRRALDLRLRVGNVLTYTTNIVETVDFGLTLKDAGRVVVDETIPIGG
jgi:hypothetical protein